MFVTKESALKHWRKKNKQQTFVTKVKLSRIFGRSGTACATNMKYLKSFI